MSEGLDDEGLATLLMPVLTAAGEGSLLPPLYYGGDLAHAANAGPFGLSASVWSSSVDTAHSLAHAIDAGYVWVNNWLARDLAMPVGGWKESGNGQRSGGLFDVDFFTYSKTTCVEITGRHAITGMAYA